nr:MAG TPA: hypothetical protein [Caudoviricetes sp.]
MAADCPLRSFQQLKRFKVTITEKFNHHLYH